MEMKICHSSSSSSFFSLPIILFRKLKGNLTKEKDVFKIYKSGRNLK
jgi:hypothetical protein